MSDPDVSRPAAGTEADADESDNRWYWRITVGLAAVLVVDLVFLVLEAQWFNVFLVLVVLALIIGPRVFRERLPVDIPAEFHLAALIFVFAAVFLGEIRSYYARIWWWDIALHTSSGLLLGIVGFLLIYVLNENRRVDIHMRPRFIALFAFLFAVSVGAIWEIFEYSMDRLFGTNMQKPMLGDDSGLTDTMWDLIVDAIGALTVSLLGWWHMRRGTHSFIETWVQKFITRNPRLFRQ